MVEEKKEKKSQRILEKLEKAGTKSRITIAKPEVKKIPKKLERTGTKSREKKISKKDWTRSATF